MWEFFFEFCFERLVETINLFFEEWLKLLIVVLARKWDVLLTNFKWAVVNSIRKWAVHIANGLYVLCHTLVGLLS